MFSGPVSPLQLDRCPGMRDRTRGMDTRTRKSLIQQGFSSDDLERVPGVGRLARWTPLSCAALGGAGLAFGPIAALGMAVCPCTLFAVLGLGVGSGWFFAVLGLLTLTGGLTRRSIFDRVYNGLVRPLLRTAPVPEHGPPRQFGCTIGGAFYVLSAIGFFTGNVWMAYAPAGLLIVLALVAGITQWCFASALYALLFSRQPKRDSIPLSSI